MPQDNSYRSAIDRPFLLVASLFGAAVPLLAHRPRRDPAMGSSIMLIFTTDSIFFIFPDLATLFLL